MQSGKYPRLLFDSLIKNYAENLSGLKTLCAGGGGTAAHILFWTEIGK